MSEKKKFDPRKLMEQAIEVMKKSVSEPRDDDKASPLVGAVLVKPDGSIETAHRGELSAEEQKGLSYLSSQTSITSKEYIEHTGVEERTAQRHLKHFMELGLVEREGSGRATRYKVVKI